MHEMSLAEGVLRILEEQAAAQNFVRVKTVWLEIGELSHVDPDAIRFCFDAVVKDTLADGAALDIVRVPGQAWCHDCARGVAVSTLTEPCPHCGGHKLLVTGGEEMRVSELEVE
ncbi:MAG: hydrogenase maturation nickel metallochaperone HypA [Alphaproteobacteria bacterium]|nr:hydrogenase maturation nickel metallochaperone HypA [Alphaproteobacteria bacterium]MBF0249170.1 hydrogenase maturation nickel metallochaperone HypA [Alphaproteobacteria bacterium]